MASPGGGLFPAMWQQLCDAAVEVTRNPVEDVASVGPRIMPVELCRLNEAYHDSLALASQLAAAEEPCLPIAQGLICRAMKLF